MPLGNNKNSGLKMFNNKKKQHAEASSVKTP